MLFMASSVLLAFRRYLPCPGLSGLKPGAGVFLGIRAPEHIRAKADAMPNATPPRWAACGGMPDPQEPATVRTMHPAATHISRISPNRKRFPRLEGMSMAVAPMTPSTAAEAPVRYVPGAYPVTAAAVI